MWECIPVWLCLKLYDWPDLTGLLGPGINLNRSSTSPQKWSVLVAWAILVLFLSQFRIQSTYLKGFPFWARRKKTLSIPEELEWCTNSATQSQQNGNIILPLFINNNISPCTTEHKAPLKLIPSYISWKLQQRSSTVRNSGIYSERNQIDCLALRVFVYRRKETITRAWCM